MSNRTGSKRGEACAARHRHHRVLPDSEVSRCGNVTILQRYDPLIYAILKFRASRMSKLCARSQNSDIHVDVVSHGVWERSGAKSRCGGI